jgi:hypothetical protein
MHQHRSGVEQPLKGLRHPRFLLRLGVFAVEVVWHDLKAYQLAHKTFTDVAELDAVIHTAVKDLNRERMAIPLAKPGISA